MPTPKTIDQSPTISDDILFQFNIVNDDGDFISPYVINKAVIYFLSRDFIDGNPQAYSSSTGELDVTTYFNKAQVIKIFGDDDVPLWERSSQEESLVTETTTGNFDLIWRPEFSREGDYIFCYTWTPVIAGDRSSNYFKFSLDSDLQASTTIPTHITNPDKYTTLLDRYTPEYLKLQLGDEDLTADVLNKFNLAISDGFILIENIINQIVDLQDSNAVNDQTLIFLANCFNLKLRSNDITAWRRQIKRAIPSFKQKGTLKGLTEALSQAKIKLNSLTQLWQVVSPYTWTESFTVSGDQVEFELNRIPNSLVDFELSFRPAGEADSQVLSTDYATITYLEDDFKYILTWIGQTVDDNPIELIDGDIIKIKYYVSSPVDSEIEDYIQSLPLSDDRDEATVTYPLKNWNVRLIEDTDPLFSTICPLKNPYRDLVVYGQVRTEFPYSENIYNMETYNGRLEDSNDPCDLSKTFVDECSCCMSSKYNINIEIDEISTSRIAEANEVIAEYTPFHAQPHSINIQAGVNDFVPPPEENVEFLVKIKAFDQVASSQMIFNRFMGDGYTSGVDVKREMLATAVEVAADTGTGTNDYIVLYSTKVDFDINATGIDYESNVLEILSGPDKGEYRISKSIGKNAVLAQGEPDSIEYPLNTDSFPYRLSNEIYNGSVTSITQVDKFIFSDDSFDFRLSGAEAGWKIVVSSPGDVAGTYTITETFPNDNVILDGWNGVSDSSNISYSLYTDDMIQVGESSDTGSITVAREGLVDGGSNFVNDYVIQKNDYVLIGSKQYTITQLNDDDTFTISSYKAGNVGITNCRIHRRLVENDVGYLDYSGLILTTSDNYEADLAISNGNNSLGPTLEDSQFKENFLVLIGTTYYQIAEIDESVISLVGPPQNWGLAGTSVPFSIIQYTKLPVTINGQTLEFVDRRGGGTVVIGESVTPLSMTANILNTLNSHANDSQIQHEGVSIQIDWKK